MTNTAVCDWLMAHADTPIRYRIAREFLLDFKTAQALEPELFKHKAVVFWLALLKPASPPQHRWMEHGSFDFCLENALLKAVQLGLHGGLPPVTDAVGFYLDKLERCAPETLFQDFSALLTVTLLSLAEVRHERVRQAMLQRLDHLQSFSLHAADLYFSASERAKLTGVPACWKNREHFIRPAFIREYGFGFPLLYDLVGLHSLYRLQDPETDRKIDDILRYLSTDAFHRLIGNGYGILAEENGAYHSMGWDPKYPGWFDVPAYLQSGNMPRLLFFALHAARYPVARATRWFADLLHCLDTYQTAEGCYAFPAEWLAEKTGYAVLGSHLSFGENRRKHGWREIESTFFMQLLTQDHRTAQHGAS